MRKKLLLITFVIFSMIFALGCKQAAKPKQNDPTKRTAAPADSAKPPAATGAPPKAYKGPGAEQKDEAAKKDGEEEKVKPRVEPEAADAGAHEDPSKEKPATGGKVEKPQKGASQQQDTGASEDAAKDEKAIQKLNKTAWCGKKQQEENRKIVVAPIEEITNMELPKQNEATEKCIKEGRLSFSIYNLTQDSSDPNKYTLDVFAGLQKTGEGALLFKGIKGAWGKDTFTIVIESKDNHRFKELGYENFVIKAKLKADGTGFELVGEITMATPPLSPEKDTGGEDKDDDHDTHPHGLPKPVSPDPQTKADNTNPSGEVANEFCPITKEAIDKKYSSLYQEKTVYFCCEKCKETFDTASEEEQKQYVQNLLQPKQPV